MLLSPITEVFAFHHAALRPPRNFSAILAQSGLLHDRNVSVGCRVRSHNTVFGGNRHCDSGSGGSVPGMSRRQSVVQEIIADPIIFPSYRVMKRVRSGVSPVTIKSVRGKR